MKPGEPRVVAMRFFRRVTADLRARRYIESYVVALLLLVFAAVSALSDVLPDDAKWAAVLAGLGVLLYRATQPERPRGGHELLGDRSRFDGAPVASLFDGVRDVRIFAPSAANLLSPHTCETLRESVLRHEKATVRVVVLDPGGSEAIAIASRHLDESDGQVQSLPTALATTIERLRRMSGWQVPGNMEYRLYPYNPGFSLVLLDPETWHGRAIVELHGAGHLSTFSRMHIDLRRERHERWFTYWVQQFEHLWASAERPLPPSGDSGPASA